MANSLCKVLLTEARLEARGGFDDSPPSSSPSRTARLHRLAPTSSVVAIGVGAIVNFWGVVRTLEDEREIEGIDYEAHRTMAEHQLRLVAEEAASKFRLKQVTLHHRIGFVRAGEASLFLQVGAEHRAAAFEASEWIVDELKRKVPIWKRPKFEIDNPVAGVVDAGPRSATAATVAQTSSAVSRR